MPKVTQDGVVAKFFHVLQIEASVRIAWWAESSRISSFHWDATILQHVDLGLKAKSFTCPSLNPRRVGTVGFLQCHQGNFELSRGALLNVNHFSIKVSLPHIYGFQIYWSFLSDPTQKVLNNSAMYLSLILKVKPVDITCLYSQTSMPSIMRIALS